MDPITFRPTVETRRMLDSMIERMQINQSAVINLALTRLYREEIGMAERERAERRVNKSQKLSQHSETIMYDWPEGDEHWKWVATAPESEIIEWAEAVEGD